MSYDSSKITAVMCHHIKDRSCRMLLKVKVSIVLAAHSLCASASPDAKVPSGIGIYIIELSLSILITGPVHLRSSSAHRSVIIDPHHLHTPQERCVNI